MDVSPPDESSSAMDSNTASTACLAWLLSMPAREATCWASSFLFMGYSSPSADGGHLSTRNGRNEGPWPGRTPVVAGFRETSGGAPVPDRLVGDGLAGLPRRGRALRHGPRRGAAHAVRHPRRGAPRRLRAPLRARQGRAP